MSKKKCLVVRLVGKLESAHLVVQTQQLLCGKPVIPRPGRVVTELHHLVCNHDVSEKY